MIQARHPEVANMFLEKLKGWKDTPSSVSARTLTGTMGFELPSWRALADGARPQPQEPDEFEPGISRSCVQSRKTFQGPSTLQSYGAA